MGRKQQTIRLNIFLQGHLVGEYVKNPDGSTYFTYDENWVEGGFAISQSFPLITTPYKGDKARSYFENLLPDLNEARELIAAKVHANSSDHFDLLMAIGHDCIGALLFTEQSDINLVKDREPEGKILSNKDIGEIVRNLKSQPLGVDGDIEDFRISLAGVQEKTALLRWKNKWQRPIGVTPTTHIIKPAMKFETGGLDMRTSVHNEYFCMKLCQHLGLNIAEVDLEDFDGELVLIVKRFDRLEKNGIIYRKPQEDMCQALGYFSNKKYQCDGGPSISDLVSILQTSVKRQEDLEQFYKSLIIYFILGAIDGHAKNYSIEYVKEGHQLTPLYDILSIFPALDEKQIRVGKFKMALSVGDKGHYKAKDIRRRHFLETAKKCFISEKRANEIIDEITQLVDDQVWDDIELSKLFDNEIKEQIITGLQILSKKLKA